jgi:hypothetical protein
MTTMLVEIVTMMPVVARRQTMEKIRVKVKVKRKVLKLAILPVGKAHGKIVIPRGLIEQRGEHLPTEEGLCNIYLFCNLKSWVNRFSWTTKP